MSGANSDRRDPPGAPTSKPALRRHSICFACGDLLFLSAVGMVATLVMHGMHLFDWNFAIVSIVGMAAAMLAQMLMAFGVAPLLGSIESMTPSMVVGMISPMSICTLHMFGCESSGGMALLIGAAFGALMFVFVEFYAARVRRSPGCLHPLRPR